LDQAQVWIAQRNWVQALAQHDAAIARRPDRAEFWLARARLYLMVGLLDEAARDVEEAFSRQHSPHPSAWHYRAALKAYAEDVAGYREACTEMDKRCGQARAGEVARAVYEAGTFRRDSGVPVETLKRLGDLAWSKGPRQGISPEEIARMRGFIWGREGPPWE